MVRGGGFDWPTFNSDTQTSPALIPVSPTTRAPPHYTLPQAAVMDYIPVVFFTAKGIPGEVEERLDTAAGLMAASLRAVGLLGELVGWLVRCG